MHAACAEGKNGRGKRERRHRGVAPLLYRCGGGGGQVDGVAHAVGEGRGGFGGGVPPRPTPRSIAARGQRVRAVGVAWSCRTAGVKQGRGGGSQVGPCYSPGV
jgi:hypothetical protein